jgi:hypothetical protein
VKSRKLRSLKVASIFGIVEKLVGESITEIRLVLNLHLMHPYFDNALTLGFTKIHKPHSNFSLFYRRKEIAKNGRIVFLI